MPDGTIIRNIDGNLRFVIKVSDVTPLEEDLSDRIRDKMKTRIQSILLLGNDKQKVAANGYPDLRVDCILARPVEGFDMQMLLDPLYNWDGRCIRKGDNKYGEALYNFEDYMESDVSETMVEEMKRNLRLDILK